MKTGDEHAFKTEKQNMYVTREILEKVRIIYPKQKIALLWDNAGWHKGSVVQEYIKTDGNIKIIHFPRYAPEENPQEHVWKSGRSAITHNRFIQDIDEATDDLVEYFNKTKFRYSLLGLSPISQWDVHNAGAEVLVMPCNTAHAFFEEVQSRIDTPMVSMIHAVAGHIQKKYPDISRVGILATTGTIKSGIYGRVLKESGFELMHIDGRQQDTLIMEAIYGNKGIKAGFTEEPRKLLEQAAGILCERGAEVIIMGCTEIPLVLKHTCAPLVDSSLMLAEEVLRQAMM